ncbi:MAG: HAMP domain-containing histidine kinase [Lentimicrobiaceae bacterium]|nr:HAMP domain-containing histidine kinase [Lentimicrobiaceae bacterium]
MKISNQKHVICLVLGILFAVLAGSVSYRGYLSVSPDEKYRQMQADFLHKEKTFDKLFAKLTFDPRIKTTLDLAVFCENNAVNSKDLIFYIYQDSVLSAWSSNEITPADYIAKVDTAAFQCVDNKCVYVKTAYYATNKYVGYIVLKEMGEGIAYLPLSASTAHIDQSYTVKNSNGNEEFRLVISKELKKSDLRAFGEVCLWLITFSLFFYALVLFLERIAFFKSSPNRLFAVLVPLTAVFAKTFFVYVRFPEDLFSSKYYSFSGYGSLGELFVYSYIVFFLSTFFMQYFSAKRLSRYNHRIKMSASVLFAILVFSLNLFACHIVQLIASDSFIVLNPEMIYQYNTLSITAILSIVFILWAILIFTYKSFWELFQLIGNKKRFISVLLVGFLIITLFILAEAWQDNSVKSNIFITHCLFLILHVLIVFFVLKQMKWSNILLQCLAYLILSCIVLYSTQQTIEEREEKYKESISERMLSIQDPFVFYIFSELAQEILSDSNIVKYFNEQPYNAAEIERYVFSTYLGKYTEEYRIGMETGLLSSTQDSLRFGKRLYDNYAADRISLNDTVSFRSIGFGKSEYALNLFFPQGKDNDAGRIFIVFRSYILSEEQAYMEESIQREMANYAYAGYENNILKMNVNKLDVPYLHRLSDYGLDTLYSGMKFVRQGMEHTVFQHNTMTLLVSAKTGMTWGKLSFVILLFFAQFIFLFIPIVLFLLWGNQNVWRPGFHDTIQFYTTILVTITIITTAVLFSRFFINLRVFDRMEIRNQMANKVKEIMTKSIENMDVTNLTAEIAQYSSPELAAFFDIDLLNLNIYNQNGERIKSYGKGMYINTSMNPFVLKQFSIDKYGAVTADEDFGKEKYKSSYRSITSSSGDVVGYLNLLTFGEKYDMLDPRHAQFLAKFLLICLFTTLLIVFFSMFFIRRLTRPLSKVTERLSNISLRGNEPEIEWKRDDEFGKLVETYNFLIAKLRTSAELLRQTSQEIAWKDMAKQIAHEIKNPLTPMRLTTQQFMRKLNRENIEKEQLDDYFKMILEQTDTLTEIATSFSNFAQANQREGSCQDLFSIIKNAVSAYNEKDVEIELENRTGQDAVPVFVSRSQMMQVFNNLIKNAVQAKKPDQTQRISIVLQPHGDKMWQIEVADTGTGMSPEVKAKLFQPNFTTKTSGMGLGLAVVKQIILSRGGSITFESNLGKGTTFWIMLPKSNPVA